MSDWDDHGYGGGMTGGIHSRHCTCERCVPSNKAASGEPTREVLKRERVDPPGNYTAKPLAKSDDGRAEQTAFDKWNNTPPFDDIGDGYADWLRAGFKGGYAAGLAASGAQRFTKERAQGLARSYLYGVMGYLGVSHMTDEAVDSVASRLFDDFKATPAAAQLSVVDVSSVIVEMSNGVLWRDPADGNISRMTAKLNALLRSKAGEGRG